MDVDRFRREASRMIGQLDAALRYGRWVSSPIGDDLRHELIGRREGIGVALRLFEQCLAEGASDDVGPPERSEG